MFESDKSGIEKFQILQEIFLNLSCFQIRKIICVILFSWYYYNCNHVYKLHLKRYNQNQNLLEIADQSAFKITHFRSCKN